MLQYIFKEIILSKKITKTDEFLYFKKNCYVLRAYPCLRKYLKFKDEVELMKANVLIRSLKNKVFLEKGINADLTFFMKNDTKIYLPVFSEEINQIYSDFERLSQYPYQLLVQEFKDFMIHSFATYGELLYESEFMNLVKIASEGNTSAFYHRTYHITYFISDQGSIEYKIPLFDEEEMVYEENIVEHVKDVVDAYYRYDKIGMIEQLFIHHFISYALYDRLIYLWKVEVK